MSTPTETGHGPWLVTLDVDGTILRSDETASEEVIEQVRRISAAGHQVMLATGRSPATTVPVVEYLGITPQFLVCSNGAIVMRRDPNAPGGYRREWAECFDPTDALIIELGRQLWRDHKVKSETFAKLKDIFGPNKLIELVMLMGNYASTAALLTAFDMQIHEGETPLLPAR